MEKEMKKKKTELEKVTSEFSLFRDEARRAAVNKALAELRQTKLFPDEVFEVLTPGRIFAMIEREMQAVK